MSSLSPANTPVFLQNLSAKDEHTLRMVNAHMTTLSWAQVRDIIESKQLERFQRRPSDLRRYLEYSHKLRLRYGSVSAFILQERLRWNQNPNAQGATFADQSDWKILWNDWPYCIDAGVVHLVVWTKFALDQNVETGDLTHEARSMVQHFVDTTFADKLGKETVSRFLKSGRS